MRSLSSVLVGERELLAHGRPSQNVPHERHTEASFLPNSVPNQMIPYGKGRTLGTLRNSVPEL